MDIVAPLAFTGCYSSFDQHLLSMCHSAKHGPEFLVACYSNWPQFCCVTMPVIQLETACELLQPPMPDVGMDNKVFGWSVAVPPHPTPPPKVHLQYSSIQWTSYALILLSLISLFRYSYSSIWNLSESHKTCHVHITPHFILHKEYGLTICKKFFFLTISLHSWAHFPSKCILITLMKKMFVVLPLCWFEYSRITKNKMWLAWKYCHWKIFFI